jgi:CDI immunity proteins
MNLDITKSLTQLEGHDWGPAEGDTYVIRTCHNLRNKPIGQFTVEDLRIMIGQKIGLPFLVPLALRRLQDDPLVEGDFYPGDLLMAVLRVESAWWASNPALQQVLTMILSSAATLPDELADAVSAYFAGLREAPEPPPPSRR